MMHRRRIWRHSQSWFFPFSPTGNQRPCRHLREAPQQRLGSSPNKVADTSGPSANAAATSRDAAAATQRTASLALVARSLALEWTSMGLGSR